MTENSFFPELVILAVKENGTLSEADGYYIRTRGLHRRPGRPAVGGRRDAQNVCSSVTAKDGDRTKCQELRVLCTLRRRMRPLQLY